MRKRGLLILNNTSNIAAYSIYTNTTDTVYDLIPSNAIGRMYASSISFDVSVNNPKYWTPSYNGYLTSVAITYLGGGLTSYMTTISAGGKSVYTQILNASVSWLNALTNVTSSYTFALPQKTLNYTTTLPSSNCPIIKFSGGDTFTIAYSDTGVGQATLRVSLNYNQSA